MCCRIDQRGISVVRSDAELKEIMYELYEQESVSKRNINFTYMLHALMLLATGSNEVPQNARCHSRHDHGPC